MLTLSGKLAACQLDVHASRAAASVLHNGLPVSSLIHDAAFGLELPMVHGCRSSAVHMGPPVLLFPQVVVDVEYLRMEFILDFEVAEKMRIHWDKNCKEDASAMPPTAAPCKWAWTTQQFYFERCDADQ
jgi:hypothetical protein